MKSLKLFPVLVGLSFGIFGCSADTGTSEKVATQGSQALSGDLTHIPVPCIWDGNHYKSVWDGNTVELVVADATAYCSKIGASVLSPESYSPFVAAVEQLKTSAIAAVYPGTTDSGSWTSFRANNSCDLANDTKRPYDLPFNSGTIPLGEYWWHAWGRSLGGGYSFPHTGAGTQTKELSHAACLAQSINATLNTGAGLLLPQDQQLELANVARNHAQRAVQLYTSFVAIAGADEAGTASGQTLISGLQYFFRGNDPVDGSYQYQALAGLRQDFQSSLQLLIESGKELGSLMGRSRAAKDDVPGGSDPSTYGWTVPADRVWGPGSWTHREAALQFGGDPLGITPGAAPVAWHGVAWGPEMVPYVKTDASAPQVATVLKLARRMGPLLLSLSGSSSCRKIDIPSTSYLLGASLTDGLNARACPSTLQGCGSYVADPLILQNGYSITQQHVQTAVQLIADMFGGSLSAGDATTSGRLGQCYNTPPVQTFRGTLTVNTGTNYAQLIDWDFTPRGLEDLAGRIAAQSAQGALRYPLSDYVRQTTTDFDPRSRISMELNANSLSPEGTYDGGIGWSNGGGVNFIGLREGLGVIPTLVVARHVLADVLANKPNTAQRMLPAGLEMLHTLDAAIGPSVYMIPDDVPQPGNASGPSSLIPYNEVVRIAGDIGDQFWQPAGSPLYLLRVIDTPYTGDLIRSPESTINGATIRNVIAESLGQSGVKMSPALTYDSTVSAYGRPAWKGLFPVDPNYGMYTLVAVHFPNSYAVSSTASMIAAINSAPIADLKSYVRLLGPVRGMATDYWHGTYMAFGGALGTTLQRQLTGQSANPTLPAYDGFGLPTDWVPPFSAEILGGDALTSSATYYMSSAKEAAQTASAAVQRAIQGLIDEEAQQHEIDLAQHEKQEASRKAALKAEQGLREEEIGLCGVQNPNCSISLRTTTLQSGWYSALATPLACPNGTPADQKLANPAGQELSLISGDPLNAFSLVDPTAQVSAAKQNAQIAIQMSKCLVNRVIDNFLATQVQLANSVESLLGQGAQPAFADYSGGSLQSALIEQWSAIKAPNEHLQKLKAGLDAAQATIEAANAVIAAQGQDVRIQCSAAAFARAFAAGWSGGFLSATWSAGPLIAQQEKCDAVARALGPELAKATATNKEAYAGIADRVQGITDAATRIAKSGAALAQLTTQAGLAAERVNVEEKLDQVNPLAPMSQGLFRQFRSYDIWRARALIENARRYAVAARRAVEARYAVDLSRLTQDETFVKSPSTWADEVYKYDLSLPSSVGLSTGTAVAGGIYANVVEDYVGNLQSFVNGYAVERPTATAKDDVEVLLLPGLADGTVNTRNFATTSGQVTYYTAQSRGVWMLHCPANAVVNKNAWTYLSGLDAARLACDPAGTVVADTARLYFSLDPWGRVNGSLANPPFDNRYNARWQKLAVNLVGTAIRDCKTSGDPQACYNQGFVSYDLRHQGVSWVTDYVGQWRAMNVPPGVIESGKALAIEAWLDPLKNGWETSYLSAIARTEYSMRPLGGDYMLEIQGGPDVHLERIERVQLMAGMTYWVAQK